MKFYDFIQKTAYSPVYAAQKILYSPNSRPAKIARTLMVDIPAERSLIVSIASGKGRFDKNGNLMTLVVSKNR